MKNRYLLIFAICSLVVAAIFFLIPINLFDGEVILENTNGTAFPPIKAKLSLSYFIGVGVSSDDLKGVKDFYLLPMGYFFAFLLIFGLPALISYRINLNNKNKEQSKK